MTPKQYFKGKTVFITGGTGSWGQELTRQLLAFNPKEIRIFSRGEHAQVVMMRKFNDPRLSFYLGDVRDRDRLKETTRGADVVFHLAALKHVPVCERHVWETVQTNVAGTQNVVEAATANNVKRATYVSSDKAVEPINVYGHTKAIGEKIFLNANLDPHGSTIFSCIRAGNVVGTHGSVVPLFREQIASYNQVSITDERMTRFFVPVSDMVKFLISASVNAKGGEIAIPKMSAIKIPLLARVMVKCLGDKKTKIKTIGIRPAEKIHELLLSHDEISRTVDRGFSFVVLPYAFLFEGLPHLKEYTRGGKVGVVHAYSSDRAHLLNASETEALLDRSGFLKELTSEEGHS